MEWNYAKLSMSAKRHGGPEQFMGSLLKKGIAIGLGEGIKVGRWQMAPVVWGAFVIGFVALPVGQELYAHFSRRRKNNEIEDYKEDLIHEIED